MDILIFGFGGDILIKSEDEKEIKVHSKIIDHFCDLLVRIKDSDVEQSFIPLPFSYQTIVWNFSNLYNLYTENDCLIRFSKHSTNDEQIESCIQSIRFTESLGINSEGATYTDQLISTLTSKIEFDNWLNIVESIFQDPSNSMVKLTQQILDEVSEHIEYETLELVRGNEALYDLLIKQHFEYYTAMMIKLGTKVSHRRAKDLMKRNRRKKLNITPPVKKRAKKKLYISSDDEDVDYSY